MNTTHNVLIGDDPIATANNVAAFLEFLTMTTGDLSQCAVSEEAAMGLDLCLRLAINAAQSISEGLASE